MGLVKIWEISWKLLSAACEKFCLSVKSLGTDITGIYVLIFVFVYFSIYLYIQYLSVFVNRFLDIITIFIHFSFSCLVKLQNFSI